MVFPILINWKSPLPIFIFFSKSTFSDTFSNDIEGCLPHTKNDSDQTVHNMQLASCNGFEVKRPGLEVIKLFSGSTQLLIKTKISTNKEASTGSFKSLRC